MNTSQCMSTWEMAELSLKSASESGAKYRGRLVLGNRYEAADES